MVKAWELEERAETEPDPIKALELRKQADRLRIDSLNAREEPWRLSHTVLMICFGAIIVLGFAAMCADVIAGLL
jgi:hypothetical protein